VKSQVDKVKVLVMDDDEAIRVMAWRMLDCLGCEVELVASGSEATERYKKFMQEGNPFDVVILDLSIPGDLGGKETIAKLIEVNPAAKAILSSGSDADPVFLNFRAFGFSALLPKPYTLQELEKTLQEVLLTLRKN